MGEAVIRVEGLSKRYCIGRQRPEGGLVDRLRASFRPPGEQETIWALKEVSFEVQQGEVLGIIGRNGAGKSTLLKILARITEPTSGRAVLNGRVGSLLEVGTGFHPELTGRENIYLSGAILGMKKAEIDRQFDEIVDFAEVEKFLETPVKRYSSGMYVRLAFAVAAHLQPEILLVDEVLAVGDAEFQKKCLDKMGEVTLGGRTILFVSHNMSSIQALSNRSIVLEVGNLSLNADTETAIKYYLSMSQNSASSITWNGIDAPQSEEISFINARIRNLSDEDVSEIDNRAGFKIVLKYHVYRTIRGLRIGFLLQNLVGVVICGSTDLEGCEDGIRFPGIYTSECRFPANTLNADQYTVSFGADKPPYHTQIINAQSCIRFSIIDIAGHGSQYQNLPGVIKPQLFWEVRRNEAENESNR